MLSTKRKKIDIEGYVGLGVFVFLLEIGRPVMRRDPRRGGGGRLI